MTAVTSAEVGVAAPDRVWIDSRQRWFPDLRAHLQTRQLLFLLSRRNITVQYRQTVLGFVWIVASPLITAVLFTFVFGQVAHLKSDGLPYFAFSYAGLLGWNLFSDTLTAASKSFTSNANLIMKIYFPRLVLPLSTVAVALINAAITFAIMLVLLVAYGLGFSVHLLLLPLWLLLALVLALALGIILASVSVAFRDVNYVTPFMVSLLLYVSPVAYSSSNVPSSVRYLYLINPMATIVNGCRWSLLGHTHLAAWTIAYAVAFVVISLVVSLVVFARLEWSLADVI